jgi:hypothetical protein
MGFHPGILGQKIRRLHIEAVFQTQDIIRGEDNSSSAAALGEARHLRVTPEPEAALGCQLPGLHHPHVQIYHVQLLRFFLSLSISYQNFASRKIQIVWFKPPTFDRRDQKTSKSIKFISIL